MKKTNPLKSDTFGQKVAYRVSQARRGIESIIPHKQRPWNGKRVKKPSPAKKVAKRYPRATPKKSYER